MEPVRPEGVSEEVAGWEVRAQEPDLVGIASVQVVGKECPTSWGLRVTPLAAPNAEPGW